MTPHSRPSLCHVRSRGAVAWRVEVSVIASSGAIAPDVYSRLARSNPDRHYGPENEGSVGHVPRSRLAWTVHRSHADRGQGAGATGSTTRPPCFRWGCPPRGSKGKNRKKIQAFDGFGNLVDSHIVPDGGSFRAPMELRKHAPRVSIVDAERRRNASCREPSAASNVDPCKPKLPSSAALTVSLTPQES